MNLLKLYDSNGYQDIYISKIQTRFYYHNITMSILSRNHNRDIPELAI